MTNRLVVIGWMGVKRAYLNVPKEEAIARYKRSDGIEESDELECDVFEFEFEDEFSVYDAGPKGD